MFSNGLIKKDFLDIYKNILLDQKELVAMSKKLNGKDLKDSLYIDEQIEWIKSRLSIYIHLVHLYNLINPQCISSKKSGKDYLNRIFHLEAIGLKKVTDFLHEYQSKFNNPELITYSKKCIKYNEQISILLKKFK